MASIRTQPMTRDQIAAIVDGNPRAIKAIENLLRDVSVSLPDALLAVEAVANESLAAVNVLRVQVALATSIRVPRGGFGTTTTYDAAGPVLSVDSAQLIAGILPFLPKQPKPDPAPITASLTTPDDMQFVLAQRIFGG